MSNPISRRACRRGPSIRVNRRLALLPLSLLALGCAEAEGDVRFEVWGEDYIEEAIPAAEFVDGWAVTYDRFLIVIGDVTLAHPNREQAMMPAQRVFDLAAVGPHDLGEVRGVVAGAWSEVGYTVPIATSGVTAHASVDDAGLTLMREQGYSVYASGRATDGSATKTFAWGFAEPAGYLRCVDVGGEQEVTGIVVPDGGTASVQLTIHGDHLFYDDLQSSEPGLRFANMAAADADDDGEVTLAELDAVPLSSIPLSEGTYGVGAANVDTLGDFVRMSIRTLGHFNGEGHCDAGTL